MSSENVATGLLIPLLAEEKRPFITYDDEGPIRVLFKG